MNKEIWEAMEARIRSQCTNAGLTEDETKHVVSQSYEFALANIASPVGLLIRQVLMARNSDLN